VPINGRESVAKQGEGGKREGRAAKTTAQDKDAGKMPAPREPQIPRLRSLRGSGQAGWQQKQERRQMMSPPCVRRRVGHPERQRSRQDAGATITRGRSRGGRWRSRRPRMKRRWAA